MSEKLVPDCDNKSVGLVIEDGDGSVALLKRARFPIGFAPPAGHEDDHGSPELTAVEEAYEELGLRLAVGSLIRTIIANRRVDNSCRRPGGDHHMWTVFMANTFDGTITPSVDEAKEAGWYNYATLQKLADRTRAYQARLLSEDEWQANPGLEEIWLDFFVELGYVK